MSWSYKGDMPFMPHQTLWFSVRRSSEFSRTMNQFRCMCLSKDGYFQGKTVNNMGMTSNRLILAGNESKRGGD